VGVEVVGCYEVVSELQAVRLHRVGWAIVEVTDLRRRVRELGKVGVSLGSSGV
jgi:hypothetical protein